MTKEAGIILESAFFIIFLCIAIPLVVLHVVVGLPNWLIWTLLVVAVIHWLAKRVYGGYGNDLSREVD